MKQKNRSRYLGYIYSVTVLYTLDSCLKQWRPVIVHTRRFSKLLLIIWNSSLKLCLNTPPIARYLRFGSEVHHWSQVGMRNDYLIWKHLFKTSSYPVSSGSRELCVELTLTEGAESYVRSSRSQRELGVMWGAHTQREQRVMWRDYIGSNNEVFSLLCNYL